MEEKVSEVLGLKKNFNKIDSIFKSGGTKECSSTVGEIL